MVGHNRNSRKCFHYIQQLNQQLDAEDLAAANSAARLAAIEMNATSDFAAAIPPVASMDNRPIWPGRIELIYREYIKEKETWLAAHPTTQPANYRRARGLEDLSPKACRQLLKFLPLQRLNIEATPVKLLPGQPYWSIEEIQAWSDEDARQEREIEAQMDAELTQAGGFGPLVRGRVNIERQEIADKANLDMEMYQYYL
jgi:hypothetical protein